MNRRLRILLGLAGALVLAVVLVAPIALRGGSGSGGACAKTLAFQGRTYTARSLDGATVVQALAIGVGVASGCGTGAADVDVRSVSGVRPAVAVALPAEAATVYVRRGLCAHAAGAALVRCLRR